MAEADIVSHPLARTFCGGYVDHPEHPAPQMLSEFPYLVTGGTTTCPENHANAYDLGELQQTHTENLRKMNQEFIYAYSQKVAENAYRRGLERGFAEGFSSGRAEAVGALKDSVAEIAHGVANGIEVSSHAWAHEPDESIMAGMENMYLIKDGCAAHLPASKRKLSKVMESTLQEESIESQNRRGTKFARTEIRPSGAIQSTCAVM